ncbi:MAG: hypothetical protein ACFNLF_05955 [Selenomonas noxia]
MESEKIYRLENASITKTLRVAFVQGEGTKESPCRLMWRFYLPDGRYIGEIPADGQMEREGEDHEINGYKGDSGSCRSRCHEQTLTTRLGTS